MGTCACGMRRAALAVVVALVALASPSRRAVASGVVGTGDPSTCTEGALDSALAGGGSVTFDCGASPVTITVSYKVIAADTNLDGGSLITLSGGDTTRVFTVGAGVTLSLANATISHGHSSDVGGAIENDGTLTVTNSTFSGNSAPIGGAVNNGGTLTVTNSTFSGNSATGEGGGISNGARPPSPTLSSPITRAAIAPAAPSLMVVTTSTTARHVASRAQAAPIPAAAPSVIETRCSTRQA
jgi:hypothetical protein